MIRKLLPLFVAAIMALPVPMQGQTAGMQQTETGAEENKGGVQGTVVNRNGRVPVGDAMLTLYLGDEVVMKGYSSSDGYFSFRNLPDGMYRMTVNASGFVESVVNVTVEGYVKDLMFVSLVPSQIVADIDDSNFAEFDMQDSGYDDTPAILYGNDVYTNIAGYGFSAIRFRNRGYASESQNVYLSGVKMNDALTGYTPFSLWSGLNEAMRSKESTIGVEVSDYGIGGYNGVTNILATPSSVRPGWRFSVLSNSALYRWTTAGRMRSTFPPVLEGTIG